jgi:thiosulfate/3-mercaptopyruvate sulfurtransferase
MEKSSLRIIFASCLLSICATLCAGAYAQSTNQASIPSTPTAASTAIPAAALLQPSELAQILGSSNEKPLILQVGSHVLYAQAHIPGSEFVGAGGEEAGLKALRERVTGLDRNQPVVIYCGCCPWDKCPNIRAAYWQLQTLGFNHVKALYIADNFGTNWVSLNYPVAKGR